MHVSRADHCCSDFQLDRDTYRSHSRARKLEASTRSDDRAGASSEATIADVAFSQKNENAARIYISNVTLPVLLALLPRHASLSPFFHFRGCVRTDAIARENALQDAPPIPRENEPLTTRKINR